MLSDLRTLVPEAPGFVQRDSEMRVEGVIDFWKSSYMAK